MKCVLGCFQSAVPVYDIVAASYKESPLSVVYLLLRQVVPILVTSNCNCNSNSAVGTMGVLIIALYQKRVLGIFHKIITRFYVRCY